MAYGSTQNVTTTAAVLGTQAGSGRTALIVRNPTGSGATIYVGLSDVTSANAAFEVPAGSASLVITDGQKDSLAGESWYARTSSGTATGVAVTEV